MGGLWHAVRGKEPSGHSVDWWWSMMSVFVLILSLLELDSEGCKDGAMIDGPGREP